jgi:hypothetical protein
MTVAGEYLDQMFGQSRGYVAVAYKGTDDSWQERQFAWPADRRKILGWANVHKDANVFICPALRKDAHTRKKGDGVSLRWLWADVDWEKIPADKRSIVKRRIDQVGSYVVGSGSGDNLHVYVHLSKAVTVAEHFRLNTGLRDYLYGDNKHPDNSLLRLPGMTNWKTSSGTPVRVVGGHGKRYPPTSFDRLRAFQRAARMQHSGSGVEWSPVDVAGVDRRASRASRMMPDEALGRYGARHKAVWAVTGDLVKWGCTPDEIHTLMDQFPPAVEKTQEEHGAYDVHKDVERRLQALRRAEAVVAGEASDDGSPFEELSDDDIRSMGPDDPMVRKILERRRALREADHWEATQRFLAPPEDVSWCASDALANPPTPMPYLIDGIAGAKHNIVITAQYKTGKTAFTVASLAQSLCDGTKFLGKFAVPTEGRVVGHWNCEMEGDELLDDYVRPAGYKHPERLHVANLRGYAVNILSPMGKAWTVEWLKSRRVQVWTIDSLARLLKMAGVKEKENDEVLNVLMAIDEIKVEAGVDVCFIITHTGRAEQEEGKERARGATVIDDWPDARWVMTRDGDIRFVAVEGRGVGLGTTSLVFDHTTKRCVLGVGDKHDVRADGETQTVVAIVAENPGVLATPLVKMVCSAVKCRPPRAREIITEAKDLGWIRVEVAGNKYGGKATRKHYPVVEGSVEGGATRRVVNFART